MPNKYYPIYLDLDKRNCIVIGSNHEATMKIDGLLESRALVTVISPNLKPPLKDLVDAGIIKWIPRKYQYGDLAQTFLVIVADTSDTVTNLILRSVPHSYITMYLMFIICINKSV